MSRLLLLWIAAVGIVLTLSSVQAQDHPNILLIVADDLGWGDVGYHGSEIETPNMDALAAEGLTLRRYYANPTCSPTRTSMMTGQAALRAGVTMPLNKHAKQGMPLNLQILPQFLQTAGYQTSEVGKWHLGHATVAQLPNARGFDYSYGHMLGGIGHFNHIHGGALDWHRNGKALRESGHATDLLTADAIRRIEHRDPQRPLFLYLNYTVPHLPNEALPEYMDQYNFIEDKNRRGHAAMVGHMDTAIGEVVKALESEGMRENTLVWFVSDNGGLVPGFGNATADSILSTMVDWFGVPLPFSFLEFVRSNAQDGGSDNGPYRAGKGFVYEGGVLVPSFLSFPGRLAPSELETRVTAQDVLPTLLAAAEVQAEIPQPIDGANAWPTMLGHAKLDAPDFAITGLNGEAYYRGDWKLVHPRRNSTNCLSIQPSL